MRVLIVVSILLAGCAGPVSEGPDGADPLYDGPSQEELDAQRLAERQAAKLSALRNETRHDPWGTATEHILASGSINWHDQDGDTLSRTFDRATQPIAHPCSYGGSTYFNNAVLTAVDVWNFTQRLEVTLEWDVTSYTREELRLGYRPGEGGEFQDSYPGKSGEAITLEVPWDTWAKDPHARMKDDWPIHACPDTDTLQGAPPPYFEGELRFEVKAIKMHSLEGWNVA